MNKNWLDLTSQIKRRYAKAVWVPLRVFDSQREGEFGNVGYQEVFEGVHSIAVALANRELGERYSWSDDNEHRPWAERGFYKPAEQHSHNVEIELGTRLVLQQRIPDQDHSVWHLNQDITIALGLLREGDSWLRPEEDYIEVVRLRRNAAGKPVAIEMRSEFLRDYLCARGSALRIASYRQRDAIIEELGDIDHPSEVVTEEVDGGRLEKRAYAIDRTGSPYGSSVAVFKVSRNDVDSEDDVPLMGPETNENTEASSWSFNREGLKMWRVSSEFWRDEWIEPGDHSTRVRYDTVPSDITFVVEADGARMNADALDDEDIGRWLWFSPGIVTSVLSKRGAKLKWYTRETGGLSTPGQPSVHFGVNESGLVTVYARDVARLPEWQRRLWAGFNVSPEGRVSAELLSAQVRADVADTKSPEEFLPIVLDQVDVSWRQRFGTTIVRPHDHLDEILTRVHRFRALDDAGFLSLAKDVARLTADSFDVAAAQAVAPVPKGEKRGSLKSLELALATICGAELAHATLGPLFGIYDLRLADAHLPRGDLLASLALLDITENDQPLTRGFKLIHAAVRTLTKIMLILTDRYPGAKSHV